MGLFGSKKSKVTSPPAANKLIIDVRNPFEYREGHIDGAINIPVHELRSKMEEIKSKGKPVVTYCSTGNRSEHAAYILKDNEVEVTDGGGFDSLLKKLKSSSF